MNFESPKLNDESPEEKPEDIKNKSSIKEIIGDISEKEKNKIFEKAGKAFKEQDFDNLRPFELEKNLEELEMISMANEATNKALEKYGLERFDIPAKNIHIVKEEQWQNIKKKMGSTGACYIPRSQAILVGEKHRLPKLVFLYQMIHEMIHFKSYNDFQVTDEEHPKLVSRKIGLAICTRDDKNRYFEWLNEAVVSKLNGNLFSELSHDQLFLKEREKTDEIRKKYGSYKNKNGKLLCDDDTFYMEIIEQEPVQNDSGVLEKNNKLVVDHHSPTYKSERKILDTLIDKIFERSQEKFQDREEVFDIFTKSLFTGELQSIEGLVESTFGKGTFEKIISFDKNIEKQQGLVDSL